MRMDIMHISRASTINLSNDRKKKNKVDRKQLKKVSQEKRQKLIDHLLNELKYDGGKFIQFTDEYGHVTSGILIGLVKKDKLMHYAYLTETPKERTVEYRNVKEHYKVVDSLPSNCSVLNYLWNNDSEFLYNMSMELIENDSEGLVSPLYIKTNKQKPKK